MRVVGIILAAGSSTRMGATNKLTTPWRGKPLVRHVADAVRASNLAGGVLVTGHDNDAVLRAAKWTDGEDRLISVHNDDHREGMAGSIVCGLDAAKMTNPDAVMILLGDMPLVQSTHIDQLIDTASGPTSGSIVIATNHGAWGNPVLFAASQFDQLLSMTGDKGARSIIAGNRQRVTEVEIGEAASRDFDQPSAFTP